MPGTVWNGKAYIFYVHGTGSTEAPISRRHVCLFFLSLFSGRGIYIAGNMNQAIEHIYRDEPNPF